MAGGLVAELNKRKDELEAANKRIAELKTELDKHKWISVDDKLPEKNPEFSHCLIFRPDAMESQGSKVQVVPSEMVRIMTDTKLWKYLEPPQ